jgi:hypothetical protein
MGSTGGRTSFIRLLKWDEGCGWLNDGELFHRGGRTEVSDLERERDGEGGRRKSSVWTVAGRSVAVRLVDWADAGKLNGRPEGPADPAPGRNSDAGSDGAEFADGSDE